MEGSFSTAVGIEAVAELLVIATAVALFTKRVVRVPYTVALVLVGLAVGFSHLFHPIGLSTDVILLVFLPPLLFEGTTAMNLGTLREKWLEVALLALPLTFLSVGAVAWAAVHLLQVGWPVALLLGAILAPTDPVSVLAILRETGVSKKLAIVIDGESCFNDGLGVVLFLIVSRLVAGEDVGAGLAARVFLLEVAGGLAVGLVLGGFTHLLLRKIDDHLLEVMISVALAYGAYVLAHRLHVSGVMAVVAAGLIMGNYGRVLAMSPTSRIALTHFWEVMAFLANSLLFLLMGIAVQSAQLGTHAIPILGVWLALTASRMVLVLLVGLVLRACGRPMPLSWQLVIGWAGLRGSIPVALALGLTLPVTAGVSAESLLTVVFGVVGLSLVVQGLTVKPLIAKLGLAGMDPPARVYERLVGERTALAGAAQRLEALRAAGQIPLPLHVELRDRLERREGALSGQLQAHLQAHPELDRLRRLDTVRILLLAERAAAEQAFADGVIDHETLEHLTRDLDARIDDPALELAQVLPPAPDESRTGPVEEEDPERDVESI